ncbi:MAG: hypothetical protein ACE5J9_02755 [Methanosarcinales archaeon]
MSMSKSQKIWLMENGFFAKRQLYMDGILQEELELKRPVPPTLKDDAYHYKYALDGVNDELYTEWWYFNVYTEELQFLTAYFLSDPGNITGNGYSEVLVAVYGNGMPLIGVWRNNRV